MALVRVEDGRAGPAAARVVPASSTSPSIDDDVGPLVDLVLLQLLARGQLDQDRPRLAAGGVQDLRLVRLDVERRRSQCSMRPRRGLRVTVGSPAASPPASASLAQLRDRLADEARDVHLRDADALADLGLGEVLREAQPQDLALALGQHAHQALDGRGVLGDAEARVLDADRVARAVRRPRRRRRAGGRARPRGRRRRPRAPRAPAPRSRPMRSAISASVGARPSSRGSSLATRSTRTRQLLQVARDADRPALVAEVALELAEDRRHGEGRERGLARRVEAVDRLEQAERGDLDEVVELLAAALVAPRELAGERQEALDQRLARGRVAVRGAALEQRAILAGAGARGSACLERSGYAPACCRPAHAPCRCSPKPMVSTSQRFDAPVSWGADASRRGAGPRASTLYPCVATALTSALAVGTTHGARICAS